MADSTSVDVGVHRYVPSYFEIGGSSDDRSPQLHELQIAENERWARARARRVEAHAKRVARELRRHSRGKQPGECTNGKRQAVWCVELNRKFDSVSAAAAFVHRAPSNILQAIRIDVRCGGFHWSKTPPGEVAPEMPSLIGEAASINPAAEGSAAGLGAVRERPAEVRGQPIEVREQLAESAAAFPHWSEVAAAITEEDVWENAPDAVGHDPSSNEAVLGEMHHAEA